MSASIYLPRILRIGGGSSREIGSVLRELGLGKPLLVTDPFIVNRGMAQDIIDVLRESDMRTGVFADCVPDPTTDSVEAGLQAWRSGDYDCLVALGGGSSMDTAKAIAVLAKHGGRMRDYKAPKTIAAAMPVICIPTTAGTGSEATRVTVVTDTETREKMMCLGFGLLPAAALVDYELTLSMPYRLTADTGIDTLCHAMEAYVSKKANAFTDTIALDCLRTVATHLRTACNDPSNRSAREAMMLAATQGGIAFSNASVTLIHGMSRPVGAFFHVPHGMSNAMLMPVVTEYSIHGAARRYADCARAMQWAKHSDRDDRACHKLVEGLYTLCTDLQVPSPGQFSIPRASWFDNLAIMSQQALASGSPANNPVVPDAATITRLYEKVWHGLRIVPK